MEKLDLKISNFQKHIQKPAEVEQRFTPEEKAKLAKASKDFESLLTSMMLKSMTKASGGMFGKSGHGGDVLDTIFESEIAEHMTKSKGFGIAEKIYKGMTGEELNVKELILKNRPGIRSLSPINKNNGEQTLVPSKSAEQRLKKYEPIIEEASAKHGVPKNLIKSIILTESAAKADALSKAKAKGLMQLIDSTAKDMGVRNVWNPAQNVDGGTKYISKMLGKYKGDLKLSLAAYNAGPANVQKYKGVPPFDETQNYIKRVMGYLNYLDE